MSKRICFGWSALSLRYAKLYQNLLGYDRHVRNSVGGFNVLPSSCKVFWNNCDTPWTDSNPGIYVVYPWIIAQLTSTKAWSDSMDFVTYRFYSTKHAKPILVSNSEVLLVLAKHSSILWYNRQRTSWCPPEWLNQKSLGLERCHRTEVGICQSHCLSVLHQGGPIHPNHTENLVTWQVNHTFLSLCLPWHFNWPLYT